MLYGYDTAEAVCGELIEENNRLREENERLKKALEEIIRRMKDGTDKDA